MRPYALALLLWLGVALGAAPAAAHAVLQATEPADRAVLAHAPAAIVLTFNEPVSPIAAQVLDGAGRAITREAAAADGRLQIALPAGLADGTYIASWRVTSIDSHPVAGSLMFAVGPAPAAWSAAPAEEDGRWQLAFAAVRAALSMVLLLASGGALFIALVRPAPGLHQLLTRLAWGAVGVSVLGLGIQGGLLKGGAFADLLLPGTWRLGASTTRGLSAAAAIAGLLLILVSLRRNLRAGLLIGAILAAGSVALTGHTATASPRWLMAPLLALHATLAAFWLGSLAPLLDALERKKETKQAVARFSRLAVGAVPLLVFLGVILARVQLDAWEALTETRYGLLVLAKATLVTLMLGLAAVNKWGLTPRLPRSSDRLAMVIRAELALGLAVLALTAALSQTPPPVTAHVHVHDPGHSHGIAARLESGTRAAEIEITPAVAGRNLILVRLDLATEPKEVAIELAQPGAGIEPIRRTMTADNGSYLLEGPELAVAGTWTVRLDVLIDDFEKAIFETEIPIR